MSGGGQRSGLLDECRWRTDRWLRSFGPFNSHTFSFLSSPSVTRCSTVASTAEKWIGPDFRSSTVFCSSKFVVDPSSLPVLSSGVRRYPREVVGEKNVL